MKSLGIDIGSSSIKIVEMQSTNKGFQITRFHEHNLNLTPGVDQELEVIEFLRNFVVQYDPAQTKFILGLRQDRVAIRNKFFPFNDRLKIFKSLAFELEEDLPFSSDNAIFDAKIVRFIGSGAEVLACAAPKIHVEHTLQKASDIGVEPPLISAEGTAFANVFEKWNEPPQKILPPPLELQATTPEEETTSPTRSVHIILNMGHTRTLVSAFEGTTLIGVRSILWGGKNIAEAIAKKYEIPFLDAVKELKTKAFILTNKQGATFDQVTFSDTIAKSVREMARDLQLSMLEIKSEFNAEVIDVGLTGGTSQIQNLGPFLTQVLECPVNRLSILDTFPNVTLERTPEISAKAGIALGLAIEGFKKPRNPPINFMRGEFEKENKQLKLFIEKWGHTAKVIAAAVVVLFVYTSLRESFSAGLSERTQDVLKDQAKAVAGLKGSKASESGIRKYIRENKKRAADLKTLSNIASMNSALDVIKKISDASPGKNAISLDVQQIKIEDAEVVLQGYVKSPTEVQLLQQSLTNIAANGQVKNEKPTLGSLSGKTAFSFSFNIDRGVQKVTR